jgi:FkbM family methyltransferase
MSWVTHPITNRVRALSRQLGLNSIVTRLFYSRNYEDRFSKLMLGSIASGDCVWDVGGNVGLYSTLFSDLVGEKGHVFAFEPSPVNLVALRNAVTDRNNVDVLPIALGDRNGTVRFQQGSDELGATSKCLDAETTDLKQSVEVEIKRGDELVHTGRARMPNVIKIDTEGFELDVLEGFFGILCEPALRALCIEVHFGLLDARGLKDAPAIIESRLTGAGFRVTWPDASHIVATRIRE